MRKYIDLALFPFPLFPARRREGYNHPEIAETGGDRYHKAYSSINGRVYIYMCVCFKFGSSNVYWCVILRKIRENNDMKSYVSKVRIEIA